MTTYPENLSVAVNRDVLDRETGLQSLTATDQIVTIQVADGASNWIVDVEGTFVGDLHFLSSMDSAFYSEQFGKRSNSDALYDVITGSDAPATYRGSIAGFKYFHVLAQSWISGTANINIRTSQGMGPVFLVAALPPGTAHIGEVGVVNGATALHATVDNFPAFPTTQNVAVTSPSTFPVSGTVTATVSPNPLPVTGTFYPGTQPVSGTFWQVTQPISGSVTVSGSVSVSNFPATQPVSGTVAVSNFPAFPSSQAVTGTFWQATQPVSGSVTAVVSPNPLPVTGTFYQATQPVSGTVAVSNFPATQPVSGSVTATISGTPTVVVTPNPLPVTGTFFQATQPVSIAGTVAVSLASAPPDYIMAQVAAGNGWAWSTGFFTLPISLGTSNLRILLKNPSTTGKTLKIYAVTFDNPVGVSLATFLTAALSFNPSTAITTNSNTGFNQAFTGGASGVTMNYDTNAAALSGGTVMPGYLVPAAGNRVVVETNYALPSPVSGTNIIGVNIPYPLLAVAQTFQVTFYGILV